MSRHYALAMGILGERLRKHREARGISNWLLEKRTGIHRANLSAFELHGRSISKEALEKLSSVPELELSYARLRAWQILDKTTHEERNWLKAELAEMDKEGLTEQLGTSPDKIENDCTDNSPH